MTSLLTTIQTSTINGNTGSTLTIGNNLTTDAIQLGTSASTVTIGGASTTTTIGGTLTTPTINGVAGSTLAIGNNLTTDAIQIGTSTNRTSTINIGNGTLSTGQINIGSSSCNVTIGGPLASTVYGITTNGLKLYQNSLITLGNGSIIPSSIQLGYKIITTSVNTNANTNTIYNVRYGYDFICFSDNSGSGILLTPGTWLINYNIKFQTDSSTVTWIYCASSNLNLNSTSGTYGTLVNGEGQNEFNFYSAANSGYSISSSNNLFLNGSAVQQITSNTNYNIRVTIFSLSATGTLSIAGSSLTAVRIA